MEFDDVRDMIFLVKVIGGDDDIFSRKFEKV